MVIYYSALPRVQTGDYLIQDLGECHLFYFFVFETGFLSIALAVLELF